MLSWVSGSIGIFLDEMLTNLGNKGGGLSEIVSKGEAHPFLVLNELYTYSDYLKLPEPGSCQYEILDGELLRDPPSIHCISGC